MRVPSHPEADKELEYASLYYDDCWSGLGDDFLDEFEATLSRILEDPLRWPIYRGNARKLNFHRFPYAIAYEVHGDEIYVLAVMHLRRRPFYWESRTRR